MAEPDDIPEDEIPVVERETRGVLWIVAPVPIGMLVGLFLGSRLWARVPAADPSTVMVNGAVVGAVAGLLTGAFIWAFFPYKGDKKPSPARRGFDDAELEEDSSDHA